LGRAVEWGDAVRGRKMTVQPAFKAFKFNALTKRAVDAKFGRSVATTIRVVVCKAEVRHTLRCFGPDPVGASG